MGTNMGSEIKNILTRIDKTENKEKDLLLYDRKLQEGPGTSSYGLEVCKSLNLPDDFLQRAQEIRMKYRSEQTNILSLKTSHYNSKKIVSLCESCGIIRGTEIHHLQHQNRADIEGIIITENNSPFHKNHPANLMTLCEKCHYEIHKEGGEHKKVKTNKGSKIVKK